MIQLLHNYRQLQLQLQQQTHDSWDENNYSITANDTINDTVVPADNLSVDTIDAVLIQPLTSSRRGTGDTLTNVADLR